MYTARGWGMQILPHKTTGGNNNKYFKTVTLVPFNPYWEMHDPGDDGNTFSLAHGNRKRSFS